MSWGGTGERWDLLQLHRGGPLDGGDRLREQIRHHLMMVAAQEPSDRLQFRGVAESKVRGTTLKVQLDEHGRSWAPATELLDRYEISYRWDDASQRILVDTIDVVPTFREEAVQRSLGWPIFELSIQSGRRQCCWWAFFGLRWGWLRLGAGFWNLQRNLGFQCNLIPSS